MHVFHKYKVISSNIGVGTYQDNITGLINRQVPMTTILYKCEKCGWFDSRNLEGQWEFKDLINK